ncbi:MAG TPA: phosphatase PAP2 family protein [Candidatus Lokiarchaeia archaeon]|nr:phosphatase PAP2 family protein [Candidatus Lokiarchaeia archaeon]
MNGPHLKLGLIGGGLFVAILTALFDFTGLDIAITSIFYDRTGTNHFPIAALEPWSWLNMNGDKAFLYVGIAIALVLLIAGFVNRRLRPFVVYALFIITCYAVGAGLIVNVLLKGTNLGDFYIGWSRPRPAETILFGGTEPYYPAWAPAFLNLHETNSSFPSGHVTSGSSFIAFFFAFNNVDFIAGMVGEKTSKRMAAIRVVKYSWLAVAVVLGILLSISRISAGAHFASDCMYAFVFTWLPATILYYWVFNIPRLERQALEKAKVIA